MSMQRQLLRTGISTLLLAWVVVAIAESRWEQLPGKTKVYGSGQPEPTCCYSESEIWKETGSQSGWSLDQRSFNPYGFPQRDSRGQRRPTPLPRDGEASNPWSVYSYGFAGDSRRSNKYDNPWDNAQYFQPASYHYPAPVYSGLGSPYGLGMYGLGDPFDPYMGGLGGPGLFYPGLGGAGLFYPGMGIYGFGPLAGPLSLYGPGLIPGIW